MRTKMMTASMIVAASFLALGGCGDTDKRDQRAASPAETARADFGAFTVMVPEAWQSQPPSSSMRKGEWQLPGDAELVLYYFGARGAGGVQDNLTRWFGQFEQPDGTPSKDHAKVGNHEVRGFAITTVDLGGTYLSKARPMATEVTKKPGWRMLAAIIETESGPYYFKLLGPDADVQAAADGFAAMIGSIKPPK